MFYSKSILHIYAIYSTQYVIPYKYTMFLYNIPYYYENIPYKYKYKYKYTVYLHTAQHYLLFYFILFHSYIFFMQYIYRVHIFIHLNDIFTVFLHHIPYFSTKSICVPKRERRLI